MEKCSLCVQRIQAGKLAAKLEKRRPNDADAQTACASACPTNAIVFGDFNNTDSDIRQLMESELNERAYTVLEEINTNPNVWYLSKVRNRENEIPAAPSVPNATVEQPS
jgi:molybdopterin-containing oxidoreductase family iron-sulfur binding subunit